MERPKLPNGFEYGPVSYVGKDGATRTVIGNHQAVLIVDGSFGPPTDGIIDNCRVTTTGIEEIRTMEAKSIGSASIDKILGIVGPKFQANECKSVKCDECNGTGQIECHHCTQDMDCGECDGTGKVDEEEDWPECLVWVGDLCIDGRYMAQMLYDRIGDVDVSASTKISTTVFLSASGWKYAQSAMDTRQRPDPNRQLV